MWTFVGRWCGWRRWCWWRWNRWVTQFPFSKSLDSNFMTYGSYRMASDWRPLQRLARSTSQAPLFHSQPRSNSLVSLLTSLFHLTHTSQLYLNHASITFAPFATFDQFLVNAPPISLPALLFLQGWTMPMPVCLASQIRISLAYREFRTHLLRLLHSPDRGPAQPPFWNTSTGFQSQLRSTSKLLSWLSSHSMPLHLHICRPLFVLMFIGVLSALLVHINFVFHMSALFSARVGSDRPALPFGIPYRSQLRHAPISIPSRNNLRHTCSLQPSPLVELSLMRLWFDDLHLFIYISLYFVRHGRYRVFEISVWQLMEYNWPSLLFFDLPSFSLERPARKIRRSRIWKNSTPRYHGSTSKGKHNKSIYHLFSSDISSHSKRRRQAASVEVLQGDLHSHLFHEWQFLQFRYLPVHCLTR